MGLTLFAEYVDAICVIDIGSETYTKVSSPSGNPASLGYFELSNGDYIKTQDTTVTEGKDYYTRAVSQGA